MTSDARSATARPNMGTGASSVLQLVKAAWTNFGRDECATRAAALAYSAVFALTPLVLLLVTIAGFIWSPVEAQRAIESQFSGLLGPSGGKQIHDMIAHSRATFGGGLLATVGSAGGLLLGATGAFLSLQDALNRAWNVTPDPSRGGVWLFLTKRLLSAGMVLGLGFILAVSLALTAGVSALGAALGAGPPTIVIEVLNFVLSFVVLAVLFAAIFKVLPDALVAWRDVWVGGVVTALLFVVGKFAIGWYLGRSKPGDAFGAASALAGILVWCYYSGMILLLGAEFTQAWAAHHGHAIVPEPGAIHATAPAERGEASGQTGTAVSGDRGSSRPAGGLVDWVIGLPVIVLLLRARRKER